MEKLEPRDKELVAIGASLASNCIPCLHYHLREAKKAGLSQPQIREAVELADMIRKVPAKKALETTEAIRDTAPESGEENCTDKGCGCSDA